MTRDERDLRRLTRASVLVSFLLVGVGALVSQTMTKGVTTRDRQTIQSTAAAVAVVAPITSTDEFQSAVAARREQSSLPILVSDPSLQTSAQGWADALPGRGIGHDPAILDGITDDWQQVAELVSSGPSFDAASRAWRLCPLRALISLPLCAERPSVWDQPGAWPAFSPLSCSSYAQSWQRVF